MGMDDKRMTVFVYNARTSVGVWMDVMIFSFIYIILQK